MVEVRKELCSICGYFRMIEVREEHRYRPPRIGTKEVLVCKECQAVRGTPQFNEYYLIALRGTVSDGGVVKARKKPESPRGPLADSFEKQIAKPIMDVQAVEQAAAVSEAQRIQRQGYLFNLMSPEMQAYVRAISYRSFLVGAVLAATLILSVFGALISLGVLHT